MLGFALKGGLEMDNPSGGLRPPTIVTIPAGEANAAASRFPLVITRPVPPLPEAQVSARAAVVEEMSLTADRTNYAVSEGEFPTYIISGAAPDQPVLWSLWRNRVNVVEDQSFGVGTDSAGQWSGRGSAWSEDQTGFWEILAKTADRQASVKFVVSLNLGDSQSTPPHQMLGVTHVAGLYRFATSQSDLEPESFLVEGAKHVRNLGATHLHAYLSPQYRNDYSFDDFGDVNYTSLPALADNAAYREMFSLPFKTFILTAYTFANWTWIQSRGHPGSIPFDANGERDELAALARHLATAYPGKDFVLKNWEGDWQMKLSFDPNAVASEEQVDEFIRWMRARQDGVKQGRADAGSDGVKHAIEFNLIHHAQRGLRSVLTSVIPEVESDLIAYASWWSLGRGSSVSRNIHDDLTLIRNLPGIGLRPLIATEFGLSYLEPDLQQRTTDVVEAFSRASVPIALYWEIFDNGPNLALVGREATRFESWHTLRTFLATRNDAEFLRDETMLPQRLTAGQQYPATVAVRNRGVMFDPVVGYALGLFNSQGELRQTVWVRREVATGETVTLEFVLKAPDVAGVYSFRMFQHGVELFGEEVPVEVQALSTPTTKQGGMRNPDLPLKTGPSG
jgi:hypothetical protein